ncbi:dephospho-CoA kinase [Microbacterium excoecariae]|uniref:dephospho-CoA kinase n=1 Tax=Microbacterium excoecariae TaxID=2715210 RepID=UPI00140764A8|nr:dephospho-CoA kinase [Microbacterium excoecariae]NHI16733.1 dephospho-CoA kinase [Microbacterium excoecariae]
MPLIALTGGIASGKSTIARRLAERGAIVIDADRVVRDLQRPGQAVLAEIAEAFGDGVLAPDGTLDRAALARIVFHDDARRAELDAIVHPAVREETQRRFRAALDADPRAVVVYDVPLLAEARGSDEWDLIVVAHAPAATRVDRLVEDRGMARADAEARVRSQASDAERLALADVVVDTSGSVTDTLRGADAVWERVAPAA